MDCGKVEKLFCGQTNQIWSSFWKTGTPCHPTKEEQGQPKLLSALSSEALHLWWLMGLHECVWQGQLTHLEKATIRCWKVYPSSRTTYAPHPDVVSFREDLAFSNMTMPDHICINYNIIRLRRRRIRVLKWPACSPDLSAIENIWRIIKRKMRQRRPKTVEQLDSLY